MAEIVNIASLTIEVDDVVKESVRLQKEIDKMKQAQKDLDRTTATGEATYQKYGAQLKNLKKAYRDNQQFASALEEANKDLNRTLEVENKSTQELYDSRSQLNKIAKNIQGDTEDEVELRNKLNATIDKQTEKIREQQSEFNSGKDSIGEYTKSINAADFNLKDFVVNIQEAGGMSAFLKQGLGAARLGIIQFTQATLAFIATPVGIVLAAIAAAFLIVRNAMNRSEESTTKIKRAFAGFQGVVKGLQRLLEPLGKVLIDNIAKGFEIVEKAGFKALGVIRKGLDLIGFEKAAQDVANFTEEIENSVKQSKALTDAELELEKAQRLSRRTQLEFQKEAEKLRQIRDDENKTIAERKKANEDLGKVLDKQLNEELRLAQKSLEVSNLRVSLDGETTDALNSQADALTEIADIEERITGQQSEQLVNRVALQKEAADKAKEQREAEAEQAKEIAEQAVSLQQYELDKFIESNSVKAKTLKESLAIEEEAARKKIEILDNELNNKLISQEEYNLSLLSINNDLLKRRSELSVDNARKELDEYLRTSKTKIDSDKYLNEESVRLEVERLKGIAEAKKAYESTRLKQGVISEDAYNDAINAINEANISANEAIEAERREADKQRQLIDAQNKLAYIEETNNNEFKLLNDKLDRERQAEIEAAERTGADIYLIDKKYVAKKKQLELDVATAQQNGFKSVFDSYADLLGEQTAAGKAAAIASTTIATYQGAQNAYTSLSSIPVVGVGLGIAAAAAAVASGLKNVNKIINTYEDGGLLVGASHARGGIPFAVGGRLGFEAEGGEAIINKKSTAMYRPLLSALNVAGGGKKFAGGGIAGATGSYKGSSLIDYDVLANRIAEANKMIPNPIVSVEEISRVSNNVSIVESLATI